MQDITLNDLLKNILTTILAHSLQCLDQIIHSEKKKEIIAWKSWFFGDDSKKFMEPQLVHHKSQIYWHFYMPMHNFGMGSLPETLDHKFINIFI